MADLITLNCPTCGGNLQVTNDVERFVCAHCGNAHIIDPGVRVESLAGELDQMRLTMDIRQAEDDLAILRRRKVEIELLLAQQRESQRAWKFLLIVLPIGLISYGIYTGGLFGLALWLAILLGGFLLLVAWAVPAPGFHKNDQLELKRLNGRIKSGDRTLSFLKQELQRVTNR